MDKNGHVDLSHKADAGGQYDQDTNSTCSDETCTEDKWICHHGRGNHVGSQACTKTGKTWYENLKLWCFAHVSIWGVWFYHLSKVKETSCAQHVRVRPSALPWKRLFAPVWVCYGSKKNNEVKYWRLLRIAGNTWQSLRKIVRYCKLLRYSRAKCGSRDLMFPRNSQFPPS